MKNAIVTGASGFLGRHLVRKLSEKDVSVLAVCHNYIPEELKNPQVKAIQADLSEPNVLSEHVNKDTVLFHMAANANVMASVESPREDFQASFYSYFNILETVRQNGGRLILPSTASIFDRENPLPVPEKSFARPSSPYGAAKLAAESYSFAYHRSYDVDVRIARLFSVYGEGMTRFLIFDLVKKIQANPTELSLFGDGNQIRDYLYVDDAIEGLILIAEKGVPGEDYNLASGSRVRILDLARNICEITGHSNLPIKPQGDVRASEVPKWYGDITKIKNIGFSPSVSLPEGLAKTIPWIQNYLKSEMS